LGQPFPTSSTGTAKGQQEDSSKGDALELEGYWRPCELLSEVNCRWGLGWTEEFCVIDVAGSVVRLETSLEEMIRFHRAWKTKMWLLEGAVAGHHHHDRKDKTIGHLGLK